MANAKKCDRCGELYEARVTAPDIQISIHRHPYRGLILDLCDDCYISLKDWLNQKGKAMLLIKNEVEAADT